MCIYGYPNSGNGTQYCGDGWWVLLDIAVFPR